jgi:hypothetical protein
VENGVQKGCKKIMVLYKSSKKGSKPDKSNWVMHQYHLGTEEEEKEGEFVVSKIFYQQPKQTDNNDSGLVVEDSDIMTLRASPRTPKANPPNPPRAGKSVLSDDVADNNIIPSSAQVGSVILSVLFHSNQYTPWVNYWGRSVMIMGKKGKENVVEKRKKEEYAVTSITIF